MPFAIVAEYPLGAYRAHVGEGQPDPWPSPLRLHAALLAAAGQGVRAEEVDGALQPRTEDLQALTWLEDNPPDGVALPFATPSRPDYAVFRDAGLLAPKLRSIKKARKPGPWPVALQGSISYVWEADPPAAVREILEDLCPDVAYLGQAEAPVRLRIASAAATHRREAHAGLRPGRRGTIDLDAPASGRTAALTQAYARAHHAPQPSPAADRATTDEYDLRPPVIPEAVIPLRFVPDEPLPSAAAPWTRAWLLPIEDTRDSVALRLEDRVAWAVALHRALISLIGKGAPVAPSLITGNYAEGVVIPANRISIQLVDAHPAMAHSLRTARAFVIAVPAGADGVDVAVLSQAVTALREVRGPRGRILRIAHDPGEPVSLIDATRFWKPPEEGLDRCWTTFPAVPETRPPDDDGRWGFVDAVLLSIGLVWRDHLAAVEPQLAGLPRPLRMRRTAALAQEYGCEVHSLHPVTSIPASRLVHKVPRDLVLRPYVAVLHLGDLEETGQALAAIGQSRHLGGGLLTPLDIPAGTREMWRQSWRS